jgi:hypothetical protein
VIGNYALIFGKFGLPALGVEGAAISTSLSRCIAFALALCVLSFWKTPIRLQWREGFRIRLQWVKRIVRVGGTAAIEQLIMQIGFMMFALRAMKKRVLVRLFLKISKMALSIRLKNLRANSKKCQSNSSTKSSQNLATIC